ncbi:hypothetical protein C3L33_17816, partial [Rhododendron williamsianum]
MDPTPSDLLHQLGSLVFISAGDFCSPNDELLRGFGTFGFDVHHRYSDTVKGILDVDGWPEKGSVDYYAAMAHHDHLLRGRHLAGGGGSTPLTFSGSNETFRISAFGFLYYANVTVGSPGLWFLVALDTGSDQFWLPCDCGKNCIHDLDFTTGQIPFEYCYDLSENHISSISSEIPKVNLTMKGGDKFYVTHPIVIVSFQVRFAKWRLCILLGPCQKEDINIIGQNFMTGYSMVFDRENMVLGWEESNCYGAETGTFYPPESSAVPPASLNPEATSKGSPNTSPSPPNIQPA